jgi:hypothetical protein
MILYAKQVKNGRRFDTHFYRDESCTEFVAIWPWNHSNRPVRRKYVVLNCNRYRLVYVKEAK